MRALLILLVALLPLTAIARPESAACPPGTEPVGNGACTHGNDPFPKDGRKRKKPRPPKPPVSCDDGQSGARIQVLYGGTEPLTERDAAAIRAALAEMQDIFARSAAQTGGFRAVRLVTGEDCQPLVEGVVLSHEDLVTYQVMVATLEARGYTRSDRHVLLFADANRYCGIASMHVDDRPSRKNLNEGGRGFARVDRGCWGGFAAAHEVTHLLGGVQPTAPNATDGFHCTDELDVMCYEDAPGVQMRLVCDGLELLDCNHDDYFHTNPTDGYLTDHWNVADSRFLDASPRHDDRQWDTEG